MNNNHLATLSTQVSIKQQSPGFDINATHLSSVYQDCHIICNIFCKPSGADTRAFYFKNLTHARPTSAAFTKSATSSAKSSANPEVLMPARRWLLRALA